MANNIVLNVTALVALVPASLLPYRRAAPRPDLLFWVLLAVAVAGPAVASLVQFAGSWQTGLAGALWISTTASAALFAVLALLSRAAWRLGARTEELTDDDADGRHSRTEIWISPERPRTLLKARSETFVGAITLELEETAPSAPLRASRCADTIRAGL